MKRILREPLLHFVLIGALLFAAYAVVNRDSDPANDEIVVSAAQVENLAVQFARTWQRPPTRSELDGLIDTYVREEVLYREGVAMGLDRDDQIIRRRVQQKLEFLAQSMASQEPTEEQLAAYFREHRDQFVLEPRYSFSQVYLKTEGREAQTQTRAAAVLAHLQRPGAGGSQERLGDASLLPDAFDDVREAEITGALGEVFTRELPKLTLGKWQGPVSSVYGVHLVLLTQRTDAKEPSLEDVQDLVKREWTRDRQQKASEAFYQELRKRYAVKIEAAGDAE